MYQIKFPIFIFHYAQRPDSEFSLYLRSLSEKLSSQRLLKTNKIRIDQSAICARFSVVPSLQ